MTINLTFENYDEMTGFCRQLLSEKKKETADAPAEDQQITTPAAPTETQEPVSETDNSPETEPAKEYTLDDLTKAAMALMNAGRKTDLQGLLQKYNAPALPNLSKDQYAAFAEDLEFLRRS